METPQTPRVLKNYTLEQTPVTIGRVESYQDILLRIKQNPWVRKAMAGAQSSVSQQPLLEGTEKDILQLINDIDQIHKRPESQGENIKNLLSWLEEQQSIKEAKEKYAEPMAKIPGEKSEATWREEVEPLPEVRGPEPTEAQRRYAQQVNELRELAQNDPKAVAEVVEGLMKQDQAEAIGTGQVREPVETAGESAVEQSVTSAVVNPPAKGLWGRFLNRVLGPDSGKDAFAPTQRETQTPAQPTVPTPAAEPAAPATPAPATEVPSEHTPAVEPRPQVSGTEIPVSDEERSAAQALYDNMGYNRAISSFQSMLRNTDPELVRHGERMIVLINEIHKQRTAKKPEEEKPDTAGGQAAEPAALHVEDTIEEFEKLARDNPERVAEVIEFWLAEDKRRKE